MSPFGTVESVQPIAAAPPNLRDEMCGGHRKRPASEDEDDLVANNNPESPYAVFLASLHPGKAKGTAPLQERGEPVLVYTGTKPPAPGAQVSTESKPEKKTESKPEKKKAAAIKPTAKDKDDASPAGTAASRAAPKPKPKSPAAKDGTKDGAKDGGSATAADSGDGTAPKPKPKKPAPKPPPMVVTPAADQSSQAK
jgi:D-alanyl-D-alanine carboxypeptidase